MSRKNKKSGPNVSPLGPEKNELNPYCLFEGGRSFTQVVVGQQT